MLNVESGLLVNAVCPYWINKGIGFFSLFAVIVIFVIFVAAPLLILLFLLLLSYFIPLRISFNSIIFYYAILLFLRDCRVEFISIDWFGLDWILFEFSCDTNKQE